MRTLYPCSDCGRYHRPLRQKRCHFAHEARARCVLLGSTVENFRQHLNQEEIDQDNIDYQNIKTPVCFIVKSETNSISQEGIVNNQRGSTEQIEMHVRKDISNNQADIPQVKTEPSDQDVIVEEKDDHNINVPIKEDEDLLDDDTNSSQHIESLNATVQDDNHIGADLILCHECGYKHKPIGPLPCSFADQTCALCLTLGINTDDFLQFLSRDEIYTDKNHLLEADAKVYQCLVCLKYFRTMPALKHHVKEHTQETPELNKVLEQRPNVKPVGENITHFKLLSESMDSYEPHLSIVIAHGVHECPVCYDCFESNASLEHHLASHPDYRDYICTDCGMKVKTVSQLITHSFLHKKKRQCPICSRWFRSIGDLMVHEVEHGHGETKAHICYICLKSKHQNAFVSAGNFRKHMMLHFHVPFCLLCGQFMEKDQYESHQEECELNWCANDSLVCLLCKKSFLCYEELKTHMISHTPSIFICVICHQLQTDLDRHLNVHLMRQPNKTFLEKQKRFRCKSLAVIRFLQSQITTDSIPVQDTEPDIPVHNNKPSIVNTLGSKSEDTFLRAKEVKDLSYACMECGRRVRVKLQSIEHSYSKLHEDGKCAKCSPDFKRLKLHSTGKQVHKCVKCGTVLRGARELKQHIVRRHPENFVCCICCEIFSEDVKYNDHIEEHRVKNKLCHKCIYLTPDMSKPLTKFRDHDVQCSQCGIFLNTDKEISCSECGDKFPDLISLLWHLVTHVTDDNCCPLCPNQLNESRRSQINYHVHFKYRHFERPNPPHKCPECGLNYETPSGLYDHMMKRCRKGFPFFSKKATIKKKHQCVECAYSSYDAWHLREHVEAKHTGRNSRYCKQCKLTFDTVEERLEHRKTHFIYLCPICGQKFDKLARRNKHMETHANKAVICPTCGKRLHSEGWYLRHVCPKEIIRFPCLTCGAPFKKPMFRNRHMKNCTGKKDTEAKTQGPTPQSRYSVICHSCGLSFTKSAFSQHLCPKVKVASFSCDLCGRNWVSERSRNQHMKTCRGKKKRIVKTSQASRPSIDKQLFPCRYCGDIFNTDVEREEHTRLHSGLDYSSCVICVNGFTNITHLEDHLASHLTVPDLVVGDM